MGLTKGSVTGRTRIEGVDADNLVICAGSQELAARRESDCVNGSGMVAHRRKLLRFVVFGVDRIVDRLRRPYPHVAIFTVLARVPPWY